VFTVREHKSPTQTTESKSQGHSTIFVEWEGGGRCWFGKSGGSISLRETFPDLPLGDLASQWGEAI
jgi:hypothetical protein